MRTKEKEVLAYQCPVCKEIFFFENVGECTAVELANCLHGFSLCPNCLHHYAWEEFMKQLYLISLSFKEAGISVDEVIEKTMIDLGREEEDFFDSWTVVLFYLGRGDE